MQNKRTEIYSFLVSRLKLFDDDRLTLKKDRGFSDEIINQFRFMSVAEENITVETELRSKFGEHELISAGIFILDGNIARINPTLCDRTKTKIIIPYIDQAGDVYHLRPHKLGLSGIGIEVYQDQNLQNNFGEIVLTEGEFKAAASVQFGVPALAVPGISSFSEKLYPSLSGLLKKQGIKRITIVFDNEVKDNPALPKRYKENPLARYDTQFYAYYMAHKLERDNFEVLIATLPESWQIDGKADIDGALAQGKTRQDFLTVLYKAVPRNEFLNAMELDARQIVLRKLAKKRFRSNIRREFNKYVVTRQTR